MRFLQILTPLLLILGTLQAQSYATFKSHPSYPKFYKIYQDSKLLKQAKAKNTKIKIDISQQRIKLIVGNKVALDAPCTTGMKHKVDPNTKQVSNKETPKGVFKIQEKIADKRSSIFGKLYRGKKMVWRGDRRKYKGPAARYEGASLKYWMRIAGAIGIHASTHIFRVPHSNGCVRVPPKVAKVIFKKVDRRTKVVVVP